MWEKERSQVFPQSPKSKLFLTRKYSYPGPSSWCKPVVIAHSRGLLSVTHFHPSLLEGSTIIRARTGATPRSPATCCLTRGTSDSDESTLHPPHLAHTVLSDSWYPHRGSPIWSTELSRQLLGSALLGLVPVILLMTRVTSVALG